MTENEVNTKVKDWILASGYTHYKGILNEGKGQVPIPTVGGREVLIDHQGFNDFTKDLIWIEAKGENDNLSELLEGFIRLVAACYYGGGKGVLAIPSREYEKLMQHKTFLRQIARAAERQLGVLNVETGEIGWLVSSHLN